MIKAIIFDIGGVNIFDNPMNFLTKLEKKAGMSKEEIYSNTWETEEWTILYNKGLLTDKQLLEELEKRGKVKKEVLTTIMKNARKEILKLIPGTIQIVKELKKRYKVYALSNVDRSSVEYEEKEFSIYKIFDGVVLSCDVGMVKPEPEIYKFVLKKFNLKPEECIFIDNRKDNVEGAEKVGIKSIFSLRRPSYC